VTGILASCLILPLVTTDPITHPIWGQNVPGPALKDPSAVPTLTVFRPDGPVNGTAVVVCPGGGYGFLAVDHEGRDVANWLTSRGVMAFVLKYRIANKAPAKPPSANPLWSNWPQAATPLHPGPLLDVQRAIRTVRARAKEFGIDPKRIGVWGFSAGGHLASSAATHFDAGKPDSADPVERVSCRPDFAILSYPVISMDPKMTHGGSRDNLLGKSPKPELVELMSNDRQVTKDTPPTFLFHTDADTGVFPENSVLFYLALKKHKVPAEMHIFEKGPHGVGLGSDPKFAKVAPSVAAWPERLEAWMKGRELLK
jgi:acetyl esterase/lipase